MRSKNAFEVSGATTILSSRRHPGRTTPMGPEPPDESQRKRPVRDWLARPRRALLSSTLRGAAYATGAGLVGLLVWAIQQRLQG